MNGQQQAQPQQLIAKKPHIYQASSQQYLEVPYQHQEFPKWKYRQGKNPKLVNSPEEEKTLEGEWRDAPIAAEDLDGNAGEASELQRQNEELRKQLADLQKTKAETEKTIKEKQPERTS